MRALALTLSVAVMASAAAAEPPELYRTVTSLNWVVADLDHVAAGWAKLGFPPIQDFGELSLPVRFRGEARSALVRVARSSFAGVDVFWIQPLSGDNVYADFLERRGEGVMSLNYAVPSRPVLDAEIARLEGLGVEVLQKMEVDTGEEWLTVVHMDTEADGKYALGLTLGAAPGPSTAAPSPPLGAKLSQYALVVKDLQAVSDYWAKLGIPAMDVTHPTLTDLQYHGQPGRFDQELGWHRHGTVTWEWIAPLAGPTVYQDFLDTHGEGFHHLAFDVADIDAAGAFWSEKGFPIVQSGGWGEKGQPGSGRFAYADTTAIGGITIELLWNHPGD